MTAASERMSRKRFLALAGGAALAADGLARGSRAREHRPALTKGGTVNIWTWPGYWAPSNLSGFKKATGTNVNIASYDSSDEMYAKLKTAAGAAYDIAIPDCGWLPVLSSGPAAEDRSRARLLQPDREAVPRLQGGPPQRYSVPKDYASTGIVYDPGAIGGKIVTWTTTSTR